MRGHTLAFVVLAVFFACFAGLDTAAAQTPQPEELPEYLRDRGTGVPTSMFGTYVRRGELLVYPFFEYYRNDDEEYEPAELGFGLLQEFRGRYRASEGLLFVGYGVTDWLAVEIEAAVISASLEKSPLDPTALPARIEESGRGDLEGQVRARLARESETRPEVFGFFEIVTPNRDKRLVGTPGWEYKFGTGFIKGSRYGTFTLRLAGEYTAEESRVEPGEYAVEYLKRLSPRWRVYLGVEGTQDEVELITEAQWHLAERVFVKLNNAVGLTSKAPDWAPEIGIMFAFR